MNTTEEYKLIMYKCKNCIFKTEKGKCPKDKSSDVFMCVVNVGCISSKGIDFITEEEMSI